MKKLLLCLFLGLLPAYATQFYLDEKDSKLGFTIRHMKLMQVRGGFSSFIAKIDFDESLEMFKDVELKIPVNSINTEDKTRNLALMGEKGFCKRLYPYIIFRMKKYERTGANTGVMSGFLTIRGVSKFINLRVFLSPIIELKTPDGRTYKSFKLSFKSTITRASFDFARGISTLLIGNKIKIYGSLKAVQILKN